MRQIISFKFFFCFFLFFLSNRLSNIHGICMLKFTPDEMISRIKETILYIYSWLDYVMVKVSTHFDYPHNPFVFAGCSHLVKPHIFCSRNLNVDFNTNKLNIQEVHISIENGFLFFNDIRKPFSYEWRSYL